MIVLSKYGAPMIIWGLLSLPTPCIAQEQDIAPVSSQTMPVLMRGSFGDEVMILQERLVALGYNPGRPDGDFGPKTDAAVRKFQEAVGLNADGVVDRPTWTALGIIGKTDLIRTRPAVPGPIEEQDEIIELSESVANLLLKRTELEVDAVIRLFNSLLAKMGSRTQLEIRVAGLDGETWPMTTDYCPSRINIVLERGVVVRAYIG